MAALALFLTLLATASCKDILVGTNTTEEHKLYDEKIEASPAIWKQTQNVTVVAPEGEIINRINVTDLREGKDGEATIVEGGDGNKSVTIELKSPTVLRGFAFHIEIYTILDTTQNKGPIPFDPTEISKQQQNKPKEGNLRLNIGEDVKPPKAVAQEISTKQPVPLSTEINVNDGKRIARNSEKLNPADITKDAAASDDSKDNHGIPKTSIDKFEVLDHKYQPHHVDQDNNTEAILEMSKKSTENSTHLPLRAEKAGNHARHSRDTSKQEKQHGTTTVPPIIPNIEGALKKDEGAIVFPVEKDTKALPEMKHDDIAQAKTNKDTMSASTTVSPKTQTSTTTTEKSRAARNTESVNEKQKENIPKFTAFGDKKEDTLQIKTKKDEVSTTTTAKPKSGITTEKPRTVRGTEDEKQPKTNEEEKNIQKIPADGRVVVPKGFQPITSKTDLEKHEEDQKENKPAPYVPIAYTLQPTSTQFPSSTMKTFPNNNVKQVTSTVISESKSDESSEEEFGKSVQNKAASFAEHDSNAKPVISVQ